MKPSNSDLFGDRMKEYELAETGRRLDKTLPVYARIDGRGFSKFTKGMNRPYDARMSNAMIDTTKELVKQTNAAVGYVQSDEISLVWIPTNDNLGWFDGKVMKTTSVLSGLATSAFINGLLKWFGVDLGLKLIEKFPHFDARLINVPDEPEAANMLLWRYIDAKKNAISMAAHSQFSHKLLQNKSSKDKVELLESAGIKFDDYPYFFKRGTWIKKRVVEKELPIEILEKIPVKNRENVPSVVKRTEVYEFDIEDLLGITNRSDFLFSKG